ncbi:hypothetical protein PECL_862 [Pediococcus claussenii ATCC BAA-344]|uniref:Uncharacterized protein n=1 Tax=Pediococcus claussenii (strain ATCC BAA-344 / DSM 14800 / JCM 18046 / KCTC 3811 / LMG 21948 / P06) TaxID=701521 RepID=G8PD00_PEDCP|nr:hypothetical protein PECL_862 [Pediococcus claussenii ATCC BAA-344]
MGGWLLDDKITITKIITKRSVMVVFIIDNDNFEIKVNRVNYF